MTKLFIRNSNHRAEIDADLEGRLENLQDDGQGASVEAQQIEATQEWLSLAPDHEDEYPFTLTFEGTRAGVETQIAITVENIRDWASDDRVAEIISDENLARLREAEANDVFRSSMPTRVRDAVMMAYDALEAAGGPGTPRALSTLAALLAQRGCSHFDPAADELTSLCDVVIFG